jgi:hypothetical protein
VNALLIILKHLELALRLHAAAPWLDAQTALAHIEAAESAATDQLSSELLLGIAFVESRYDPTAVSRVERLVRRTGSYPSTTAPAQLDRRASLFCGPLQTYAPSWSACMDMRNLKVAYSAGAAELEHWLHDRRVRGSISRALAGHGCGNSGVLTGACNGYPNRVLAMQRQLSTPQPPSHTVRRVVASM